MDKLVQLNVKVPAALKRALDDLADRRGVKKAEFVRHGLGCVAAAGAIEGYVRLSPMIYLATKTVAQDSRQTTEELVNQIVGAYVGSYLNGP